MIYFLIRELYVSWYYLYWIGQQIWINNYYRDKYRNNNRRSNYMYNVYQIW
jgi:hypothetical protein